ncbi:MAG: DUF2971 domain-containing protein [Bryobacteraceae bacterium]
MEESEHEGPLQSIPDEIAEWLSDWRNIHRDFPHVLFHYTETAGLCGIIRSQQLWATHVYYVNDAQEFRYASAFIAKAFDDRIEQSPSNLTKRIAQVRDCYRGHASLWESVADTYIVCFCELGNLLSQWRAYAANGQGFALGFAPDRIMRALQSDADIATSSKLFRVIYDPRKQRQLVDSAVDRLVSALENHDEETVLDQVPLVFSEMAFCFKHDAFAEEREWRLVCLPHLPRSVDVRTSEGRLVPYATIPISLPGERPPYVEVIHGPTLEADNTKKAVQMLLGKAHPKFWPEVAISGSNAPLRSR